MRTEYVPGMRTTLAAHGPAGWRLTTIAPRSASSPRSTWIRRRSTQLGVAEVQRLHDAMLDGHARDRLQRRLPGVPASSCAPTRASTQETPEELLMRAAWIAKRFDGKAAQFFGYLPRARFAIKPVPDDLARSTPPGRGGAGVYLLNTYDLPSRPLYNLTALTLHESAPGHAFQMPIAMEHKDQPDVPPAHLYLRVWRGLGALLRAARARDGHVRDPLRPLRHARLPDLAGRAAGGRHRHPLAGLDARAGDRLLPAVHRAARARDRHRGRSLHRLAGTGAVVLPGRAGDPRGARAAPRKRSASASTSAPFTTRCWSWARCRCRCSTARIERFIAEGGRGPYPEME